MDLGISVNDDGRQLVLRRIAPETPAAAAGLRAGDVLLDVDGLPVENRGDVVLAFASSFPGRRHWLTVRRGTSELQFVVTAPGG